MKHPNHYAGTCSNYRPVFPAPRATHSHHRAGHSRTLYTSIAPEQSNIIFKNEGRKRTTLSLQTPTRQAGSDLLPSFKIGRDQPNLIDAGAAHDVDGPCHIGKAYRVVSLDEGDFFSALLEYVR
jgi:hypothetical protein